jgi:AcrR family transcriptional regulator
MPSDSSATKARILAAAYREFAAFGLAGARIDRIAATAPANKRAIYAYFGNKETLFDLVLADQLTLGAGAVPADRAELARYAGDLVDFYAADPDRARLAAWRQLERPEPDAGEVAVYRQTLDAHRAQQPATESLDPSDLLAIVTAVATSWARADNASRGARPDQDESSRREEHRAAVVESVRRILAVGPSATPHPDRPPTLPAPRKAEPPDPPMDSLF